MSQNKQLAQLFTWRTAIIKHSELPSTTRHVLITLSLHMNELGGSCFPSLNTLAKETGLTRSTVSKHLKEAESAGWLLRERREDVKKGYQSTLYYANCPVPHPQNQQPDETPPSPADEQPLVSQNNKGGASETQALVSEKHKGGAGEGARAAAKSSDSIANTTRGNTTGNATERPSANGADGHRHQRHIQTYEQAQATSSPTGDHGLTGVDYQRAGKRIKELIDEGVSEEDVDGTMWALAELKKQGKDWAQHWTMETVQKCISRYRRGDLGLNGGAGHVESLHGSDW